MIARVWLCALGAIAGMTAGVTAGCTGGDTRIRTADVALTSGTGPALTQGRAYTDLFYKKDFQRLWQRFSPEMRETFSSANALASFAARTIDTLGRERKAVKEQVIANDSVQVYSRTAEFERAPGPVTVEWALSREGTVTGFLVRAEPAESTP